MNKKLILFVFVSVINFLKLSEDNLILLIEIMQKCKYLINSLIISNSLLR